MRTILAALAVLIAAPVFGAEHQFVCHNPARSYDVTYVDGATDVIVDPDGPRLDIPVLARLGNDMLVLHVDEPGMVTVLYLSPPRRYEVYARGKLVQTDPCD